MSEIRICKGIELPTDDVGSKLCLRPITPSAASSVRQKKEPYLSGLKVIDTPLTRGQQTRPLSRSELKQLTIKKQEEDMNKSMKFESHHVKLRPVLLSDYENCKQKLLHIQKEMKTVSRFIGTDIEEKLSERPGYVNLPSSTFRRDNKASTVSEDFNSSNVSGACLLPQLKIQIFPETSRPSTANLSNENVSPIQTFNRAKYKPTHKRIQISKFAPVELWTL